MRKGTVEGKHVKMILDTGSSCTLVHKKHIPLDAFTGSSMEVRFADGSVKQIPLANVELAGNGSKMPQEVGVVAELPADVLLGHDSLELMQDLDQLSPVSKTGDTFVATRSQVLEQKLKEDKDEEEVRQSGVRTSEIKPLPQHDGPDSQVDEPVSVGSEFIRVETDSHRATEQDKTLTVTDFLLSED